MKADLTEITSQTLLEVRWGLEVLNLARCWNGLVVLTGWGNLRTGTGCSSLSCCCWELQILGCWHGQHSRADTERYRSTTKTTSLLENYSIKISQNYHFYLSVQYSFLNLINPNCETWYGQNSYSASLWYYSSAGFSSLQIGALHLNRIWNRMEKRSHSYFLPVDFTEA